ncbi:PLD nuclease N-terminal domain-containing protein [Pelagicoccus albus]|uniref:PLDc_N domain-containing protein n=1 Tax=Pelagicoccus albus TaxID=415222 RepID=A0A7X1B7I3_9BACT|nr:PLD nuclease N-terminal domain-containing protein [Pelagicoccus albus]MBC2605820.1 PLDc_N domain-containing protein [Pelagicoccus albus]
MQDANTLPAIFLILYFAFLAFSIFAAFALFGLWIWMLIDCLKNEPDNGNEKVIWILVLILLQWIGALLYYFIRRRERLKKQHLDSAKPSTPQTDGT